MRISKIAYFLVSLFAACVTTTRSAQGFEREWHIGGGLGAAVAKHYDVGPVLGLHGAYGLSDMFDVKIELLGGLHSFAEPVPAGNETGEAGNETRAGLFSAAAGIAYKLDVIQWVPYAGLLVGYYYTAGAAPANAAQHDVGFSLAVGLDYAASRNFGLGVQVRPHLVFLRDGAGLEYTSALLRAEYRWGW